MFFFEGVVDAICLLKFHEVSKLCPRFFDIWRNLAPEIFQKVDKIGPRVPQGMPKSVQVGIPPENRKIGREQKYAGVLKYQANGPKW